PTGRTGAPPVPVGRPRPTGTSRPITDIHEFKKRLFSVSCWVLPRVLRGRPQARPVTFASGRRSQLSLITSNDFQGCESKPYEIQREQITQDQNENSKKQDHSNFCRNRPGSRPRRSDLCCLEEQTRCACSRS